MALAMIFNKDTLLYDSAKVRTGKAEQLRQLPVQQINKVNWMQLNEYSQSSTGLVIDGLGWSSGWSVPPELMTGNWEGKSN